MASYFDVQQDAGLLPSTVRAHPDLAAVAQRVERDVIRRYTYTDPCTDEQLVGLRNYVADAALCTDAGLKAAMKDVIADIITWRLHGYSDNPHLSSVSPTAGTVRSLRDDSPKPYPPHGWSAQLKDWDTRPPLVLI